MRLIEQLLAATSLALLASSACRFGYDEGDVIGTLGAGQSGGSGASAGSAGSLGGDAGEAAVNGGQAGSGAVAGMGGFAGSTIGDAGEASGADGGVAGDSDPSGGTGAVTGGSTSAGGSSSGGSSAGGSSAGGSSGTTGSGGAPSLTDCEPRTFNSRTYLMCAGELTWPAATVTCDSVGMRLVRVDDAAENQWLFDNVYFLGNRPDAMWIGATDVNTDGDWIWLDGTLFWRGDNGGSPQGNLYNDWFTSAPSGANQMDCAGLDLGLGTGPGWYSGRCTATNVYACEWP